MTTASHTRLLLATRAATAIPGVLVAATVAFMLGGCSAQLGASAGQSSAPTSSTASSPSAPISTEATHAPISDAVVGSIDLEHVASSITTGAGSVWIRTTDGLVLRIDPATNAVVNQIDVGDGDYGNVRFGAGAVWVTTFDDNVVSRIDATSNEVTAGIKVGANPEGLKVTTDAVWVANHRGGSISHIDPATNKVVATIEVGHTGASGPKNIELAAGDLWTPVPNSGAVFRIDPETDTVIRSFPFNPVDGLTSNGNKPFVYSGTTIIAIDPKSEYYDELTPPIVPNAFGAGAFWAVNAGDRWRIDADSLEPGKSWHVTDDPEAYAEIAVDGNSVWLLFVDEGRLVHVDIA